MKLQILFSRSRIRNNIIKLLYAKFAHSLLSVNESFNGTHHISIHLHAGPCGSVECASDW